MGRLLAALATAIAIGFGLFALVGLIADIPLLRDTTPVATASCGPIGCHSSWYQPITTWRGTISCASGCMRA